VPSVAEVAFSVQGGVMLGIVVVFAGLALVTIGVFASLMLL
jgi:hypothetical protein